MSSMNLQETRIIRYLYRHISQATWRKYATILHLYMKEKISSAEACKNLLKKVISNFRLPYITITPIFSVCPKHGYINGEHEFCPKCDAELLEELHLKELTK